LITAFKYNDGVDPSVTMFLPTAVTLDYTVLKTLPSAVVSSLLPDETAVTFNVTITDQDSAIEGSTVTAAVFAKDTTTNPVAFVTVPVAGSNSVTVPGLATAQEYDLYIIADYNILNGTPNINTAISGKNSFTTNILNRVDITNLNLSTTTDSVIINSATLAGGYQYIISGGVTLLQNGTVIDTYLFTANDLLELNNGTLSTPVVFDTGILSNTLYTVEFNFESAVATSMDVTQSTNSNILTNRVAPTVTNASLNGVNYLKNSSAISTIDFINPDNAVISEIEVNGV